MKTLFEDRFLHSQKSVWQRTYAAFNQFFVKTLPHYQNSFNRTFNVFFVLSTWNKARILYYINNWVYTTNHKRIAVNYFWFVILSGIIGMVLATIIRLELAYPGVGIFAGDSLQYLSMVTAHGVIMVFFMIMPLLFGAFGNFLLPTQLGVHDVAFPRLNSAAFWFLPAGLIMLGQLVCIDRRYQRMNCFNIREVQSLLKRKFFADLINSHDHKKLLDTSMIGLKYKTNNNNFITHNTALFFNFGLDINNKNRIITAESSEILIGTGLRKIYEYLKYRQTKGYFKLGNTNMQIITNLKITTHFWYNNVISVSKHIISLCTIENIAALLYFLTLNWMIKLLNLLRAIVTSPFRFLKRVYYFIFNYENVEFAQIVCQTFFSDTRLCLTRTLIHTWNVAIVTLERFLDTPFVTYLIMDLFPFYQSRLAEFFPAGATQTIIEGFTCLTDKEVRQARDYVVQQRMTPWVTNFSLFFLETSYKNKQWLRNYFESHKDFLVLKKLQPFTLQNTDSSWEYLNVILYCFYNSIVFFLNILGHLFNFTHYFFVFNTFYNFFINWQLPLLFDTNWIVNLCGNYGNFTMFNVSWPLLANFFLQELCSCTFEGLRFLSIKACDTVLFFTPPLDPFLKAITPESYEFLYETGYAAYYFDFEIRSIWAHIKTQFVIFVENVFGYSLIPSKNGFTYNSEYFSNMNLLELIRYAGNELDLDSRNKRFTNPVFKYDYKAGNYFPKLYKETYTFLFTTFSDLTNALRPSSWFYAPTFKDDFFLNCNFFQNEAAKSYFTQQKHSWDKSLFLPTDGFYNFFFNIKNDTSFLSHRWITVNSLHQKFHRMFMTSSLQQRIYSNWRQLKFTREAWRCKLLAARHQKTLYRRYVNEDGVFWSIERNAKDLLPGWAMITPFSSRTRFTAIGKVDIGLMGVFLVLNSSIISGANFLVTYRYLSTLNNRKMRDARSFFAEGVMVASWMMIAANPMLVIGIIMLLSDRHWQTSFFDYSGGGDTILFQHMFWFFGHPEVYVILIPVFGFTNTILSYYLRKRVSARASLLYSMYTIAFLGFFVWGHHMYMVGLAHTTRMLFSTLTVMISVPAATKLMHWCVTLVNSSFTMELPFLFVLTFIFFFVSGGISGMFVAHTGMDILFHDTFYVIGHFHVMLAGGAMFGSFGAFYFYFPAIFGVKYSRIYAYLHYTYYLIGQLMTVIPMFWLGYAGMPRRVLDYPASMGGWHSVISAGHLLSVAGLLSFFIMIFDSLRQGRAVIRNTFGINRYNTRLNFYLYEIARLTHVQQKASFSYRYLQPTALKLGKLNYTNFEHLETTLFTYTFLKKN